VILKHRRRPGLVDVSDLRKNEVVAWNDRNYSWLSVVLAFILPSVVAGLGWGDWKGGLVYAGLIRALFLLHVCFLSFLVHVDGILMSFFQGTFCVNSFAHWLGDQPYDNKHTPRNHIFTALLTLGEGYHNFHHRVLLFSFYLTLFLAYMSLLPPFLEFPQDFRNAIKFWQYDPTKWFILGCSKVRR
jgi:stearoyl-CoA desaturase (delta-9 desaturase)